MYMYATLTAISDHFITPAPPYIFTTCRTHSNPPSPLTPHRRLSIEVDQLLSQLPPPSTQPKLKLGPSSVSKLQLEERALKGQVNSLSGRRGKLSGELNGLLSQVRIAIGISFGYILYYFVVSLLYIYSQGLIKEERACNFTISTQLAEFKRGRMNM